MADTLSGIFSHSFDLRLGLPAIHLFYSFFIYFLLTRVSFDRVIYLCDPLILFFPREFFLVLFCSSVNFFHLHIYNPNNRYH